ncbi:hypothetical protein VTL71DRAFT_12774, partial [Oculimacula yallundae]
MKERQDDTRNAMDLTKLSKAHKKELRWARVLIHKNGYRQIHWNFALHSGFLKHSVGIGSLGIVFLLLLRRYFAVLLILFGLYWC